MQILLAYAGWATLFSLLSGLPTQPNTPKPDVKLPDQAKLQGYLECCERALKTSWIIEGSYTYQLTNSFGAADKRTGRVMLLMIPFLPEVFLWQSAESRRANNQFFKLHVGHCRLFWSPGFHNIGFDLPFGELHFDCFYTDTFWKEYFRGLLIWGPSESYKVNFDLRAPVVRRRENGLVEAFFEKHIVSRGPLGLLLGMEAKQIAKRFEIKLTKDDKDYIYVEAFPKSSDDRAQFVKAQVVFDKNSFLPRRLWYAEADRDANTYHFTQLLTVP
jgi:hypothetical protein